MDGSMLPWEFVDSVVMAKPPQGFGIKDFLLPWGEEGPPHASALPAERPKEYHPLACWPPRPYSPIDRRRHVGAVKDPNDPVSRFWLLLHPEVAQDIHTRTDGPWGGRFSTHHDWSPGGWLVPKKGVFTDCLPAVFTGAKLVADEHGLLRFTPAEHPACDYAEWLPPNFPGFYMWDKQPPAEVVAALAAWRPRPKLPRDWHRTFVPPEPAPDAPPPKGPDPNPLPAVTPKYELMPDGPLGHYVAPRFEVEPRHRDPSDRSRRKRYDWGVAARCLAEGYTVSAVANEIGCSRQSVWRALRRSPGLRQVVEQRAAEMRAEHGAHLNAARPAVVLALLQSAVTERNPMTLIHLSRLLNISAGTYAEIPPELGKVKEGRG